MLPPRAAFFAILAILFLPRAAIADDASRYTIVDLFPYGWTEAGVQKGLFVDLARTVDRALGTEIPILLEPISRIRRSIDNGAFGFTITYRMTKLEPQAQYLLDLACLRTSVVSMKARPIRAVEELTGRRVAYSGSGYFSDAFAPYLELQAVQVSQTDVMFKMALRGRLDAFVIDELVWQSFKRDANPDYRVPAQRWREFAAPLYLESLPLSLSVSQSASDALRAQQARALRSDPAFVSDLRRVLNEHGLGAEQSCLNYAENSVAQ